MYMYFMGSKYFKVFGPEGPNTWTPGVPTISEGVQIPQYFLRYMDRGGGQFWGGPFFVIGL